MRRIQPTIQFWDKEAELLSLKIISDNLDSSASFLYELYELVEEAVYPEQIENEEESEEPLEPIEPYTIIKPGMKLSEGNLVIKGEDYDNWGIDPEMDSNQEAYQWAAQKLGVTLV